MVNTCHLVKHINFMKILYLFGLAQAADRTYYMGYAFFNVARPNSVRRPSLKTNDRINWQTNDDEPHSP
jgi:hypothetical protein